MPVTEMTCPSRRGAIGRGDLGNGHAQPRGLDVHHLYEREIVFVVVDGGPGELLELVGAGDVVDVRMRDDDGLYGEAMALERGLNEGDIVAGIDDDGLARGLVAEDGAVALEKADGKNLVDHASRVHTEKRKRRREACVLGEDWSSSYFFGALCCCWVGVWPERTERSDARESRIVRPTEVSMKMIAE